MKKLALVSYKSEKVLFEQLQKNYSVTIFNRSNIKQFLNEEFDRVIYVIYNKKESKFITKLMKLKRGLAILTDFYFNNLYANQNDIYLQHGFNLLYKKELNAIILPLNNEIINNAIAIILKNRYCYNLLKKYYYHINENSIYFFNDFIRKIEKIYTEKVRENYSFKDIYSSNKRFYQRQIFVDISLFKDTKLHTGIQRVVRQQLINLLELSDFNYRIEPVYLDKVGDEYFYFYAREFMKKFLNLKDFSLKDEAIDLNENDIFYGLDLVADHVNIATKEGIFKLFKHLKVKIIFLVYDLIAVKYPYFFPKIDNLKYKIWLNDIRESADALITISNSVKNDLEKYITNIPITTIHLGADIETKRILKKNKFKVPTFLMVSTIEPRKGHEDILNAFEILWNRKIKLKLIFIGREGWMVEKLLKRIHTHKYFNKYLFHLKNVNDKILIEYYQRSTAFIMASYAEGFGLPIIEAAKYNLPIIARDIPVFKEIASNHAFYFPNTSNRVNIANSVLKWLNLYKRGNYPKSKYIRHLSWKENVKKLLKFFNEIS